MSFSELFQRIKHKNHKLTDDEHNNVVQFLRQPASVFKPEAHAAIYVLCLSKAPTVENIELVKRFLASDADDYARSAAVKGLYRFWDTGASSDVDDVLGMLELSLVSSRCDTSLAAIGCAFDLMHDRNDRRLSSALMGLLETLHDEVLRENDLALTLFPYACSCAHDTWAQRSGQQRIFFETMEEALPIYWDRSKYLLSPLN